MGAKGVEKVSWQQSSKQDEPHDLVEKSILHDDHSCMMTNGSAIDHIRTVLLGLKQGWLIAGQQLMSA